VGVDIDLYVKLSVSQEGKGCPLMNLLYLLVQVCLGLLPTMHHSRATSDVRGLLQCFSERVAPACFFVIVNLRCKDTAGECVF